MPVDTDIVINFLRGEARAQKYLFLLLEKAAVYCSVATVAEIPAGMKEHEREKTTEFIDGLNIVDIDRKISEQAGKYRRDEKRQSLELDDC